MQIKYKIKFHKSKFYKSSEYLKASQSETKNGQKIGTNVLF